MPRDNVRNRPGSSAKFASQKQQPSKTSKGPVWLLAGVFIGLIIAGVFYVKNHPAQLQVSPTTSSASSDVGTSSAKEPVSPQSVSQNNAPAVQGNIAAANQKQPPNNQKLQTQFDFYNVLPGKNIVGPSGDEDASALQPQASTSNTPSPQATGSAVAAKPIQADDADDLNNDSDDSAKSDHSNDKTQPQTLNTKSKDVPASKPDKSKALGYTLQAGVFSQYSDADNLKAQLDLLGFEAKVSTYTKNGKTLTKIWLGPFRSSEEAKSVQDQLKDNAISAKLLKSQN
jgi:cell division protein FtsN